MNSNMLIAIAAVIIIAAAGTGVYFIVKDDGSDDKEIEPRDVTITDSLGNEVTVTAPLKQVCTVNTNAAEFFKILGVEDRIVGIDTSAKETLGDIYKDVTDIGNYKTPSGEIIAQTGTKYIISQSSTRSMSADTEQALKDNYGISVLRLDCFGETMMEDVKQLLKLIIDDDADDAFDEYKAAYDSVLSTVRSKASAATGDPSFLFLFTSMSYSAGTYYYTTSELSKIVESLHGHNALKDMGVTSKSSTAKPSAEKIIEYDNNTGLNFVFLRGTSSTTAEEDYQTFLNTGGALNYASELDVVAKRHVYAINTDLLSGPRDYIGQICICEAMGISTGLDYADIVSDFNEKYGFDVEYNYLIKRFPAA